MSEFWKRYCRVQCGDRIFDIKSHDIDFNITGGNSTNANTATIGVYNLAKSTLSALQPGIAMQVDAGYQDDHGIVFYGVVDSVESTVDGNDVLTTIVAKDHMKALQDAPVYIGSFPKGTRVSEIVRAIYSASGVPSGVLIDGGVVTTRPFTLVDVPATLLETLVKYTNGEVAKYNKNPPTFTAYIEHGQGFFVPTTYTDTKVIVVESATGLLTVEPIKETANTSASESATVSEEPTQTATSTAQQSLILSTLFQWRIRADTPIQLNAREYAGTYKVTKFTHTLSGDDFETKMEVKPI